MTFLCWLSSQEQVLTAVEEFKKFACMVTTLFPEGDFDYEQHVNAVTYFVNYPGNGQSLFAKAIRTLLRGTNDNEPDLLRDSVADVIRTAGSSASLRPKLQVQKSRIDVDEPSLEALLEASQMLQHFQSGLRQGECAAFTKLLLQKLIMYIERLTSGLCNEESVSTKAITALQQTMQPYEKEPVVLAALGKLTSFVTAHNKSIAEADLFDWAKAVCQKHAGGGGAPVVNHTELKNILSKCGASVTAKPAVQQACVEAIHLGIQEVLNEETRHDYCKSNLESRTT